MATTRPVPRDFHLVDGDWLWGGDPEAVAQTINVGINNANKEARVSQMLAFGRDKMLEPDAVKNVTHYVLSLSHPALAKGGGRCDQSRKRGLHCQLRRLSRPGWAQQADAWCAQSCRQHLDLWRRCGFGPDFNGMTG